MLSPLSPRESRRKGSSWRRLRDRLSKGDPYLTEIIVSADDIIDDDDDDDENVYEFLAQHLPKNTTITTISITEVEDPLLRLVEVPWDVTEDLERVF